MSTDINKVILPCSVGCLRHVIGITYFKMFDWETDEPEMFFETLHEPYEGFWMRAWRGLRFVFLREPMSSDSTLIGPETAQKLIDACESYIAEHRKWLATLQDRREQK